MTAADRAFDRRQYDRALDLFRTAADLATRADNRAYARFREALALRRLGRPLEARNAFLSLVRESPESPRAPRARYLAARILGAELGDGAREERELAALIARHPRSDAASNALKRLARLRAGRRVDDALDLLRRTYRAHRRGPLGPLALYLAAKILASRNGARDEAARLYELLARRHKKSALRDDALWHAAALHRAAGRPLRAIRLYRRLTATYRESWSMGSYNSAHLDRAALEIGLTYLRDLRDARRASRALRDFVDGFPHSMRRAEARRHLVEALVKIGRVEEARRVVDELARLFPKSRHTRAARDLVGAARR